MTTDQNLTGLIERVESAMIDYLELAFRRTDPNARAANRKAAAEFATILLALRARTTASEGGEE